MTETEVRPPHSQGPPAGPNIIAADDPRYEGMRRGYNQRHVAEVDYVVVPTSTEDVVDAVNRAVAEGKRITVRSGGHGFEGSASDDGGVLLDMSEMNELDYDPSRRAFALQPGVLVSDMYRTLYKRWGVTLPAGEGTEVGIGGHFTGGGFGPLSRRYGSTVDFMVAVEVVTVDESGQAKVIVATNDQNDPHHDLWWAHTGGGGGNFGVLTRCWVRSPGADSADPRELLPRAPTKWRSGMVAWPWDKMTEKDFVRIARNVGTWFENNSADGSPGANIMAFMYATEKAGGILSVGAMVDDDIPGGQELIDGYFDAVCEGVEVEPVMRTSEMTSQWLYFFTFPNRGDPGDMDKRRFKLKAAYLRKGYTEEQIAAAYRHLEAEDGQALQYILIGYGGHVNTVAPEATAIAQRDSILKAAFIAAWSNPDEDEFHLRNVRAMYHDVYAETGGVPVPNEYNDGSYINYPDRDLADPELNNSGVAWSTLYYKDNYPRLQRVKKAYDPRNEFHHPLSIELPD
ncbi:MAG TPA: FAD-binding oxidoreductase [Actinophytocola sp.]|nr:FAD-binding oxidoreductase [Actinophytocola sp.]